MKRIIPFIPLAALVLLACLFAFYALRLTTTRIEPNFTVGQRAPELMLPYLEGGPAVSLRGEIKGPALVNLFGSWCATCVDEAPWLAKLKQQGVRIVGVDQNDPDEGKVADFLVRWGDPYAVILRDDGGRATIDFGATGLPETFVVDSKGMIVGKQTGALENAADLNRLLTLVKTAH